MCGDHEVWRHVCTCKSLESELIRADSWSKLRKLMDTWSLSSDIWITMENVVQHYTLSPLKRDPGNMPPEPPPPFGTTFQTPRNGMKVALRVQSQIGWDNFLKGRLSHIWITCMEHHFQSNGNKLTGQECMAKLIIGGNIWITYGHIEQHISRE
jgi:hypothetical protein